MIKKPAQQLETIPSVTMTEVNQLLDVRRLLLSVLTPQELYQVQQILEA
jgi:hypothetical protein